MYSYHFYCHCCIVRYYVIVSRVDCCVVWFRLSSSRPCFQILRAPFSAVLRILSVCPGLHDNFFVFSFLIDVLLKGMVESCLLPKEKLPTPIIDEVVAVCIFRRRAQNLKIGKKWTSQYCFLSFFRSAPLEESPFWAFYLGVRNQAVIKKTGT